MAAQSWANGKDAGMDKSSNGMEVAYNEQEPNIVMEVGDHLGNFCYVLCVRRVLLNRSTCDVVADNFVARVERILTMEHALALYA
jgi:hypothetical protein